MRSYKKSTVQVGACRSRLTEREKNRQSGLYFKHMVQADPHFNSLISPRTTKPAKMKA
jgi:hypothetical protein